MLLIWSEIWMFQVTNMGKMILSGVQEVCITVIGEK